MAIVTSICVSDSQKQIFSHFYTVTTKIVPLRPKQLIFLNSGQGNQIARLNVEQKMMKFVGGSETGQNITAMALSPNNRF